jgi:hypothetical protein
MNFVNRPKLEAPRTQENTGSDTDSENVHRPAALCLL